MVASNEEYTSKRIRFEFVPATPPQKVIADILATAQRRDQVGAVALHLVGATFTICFPYGRIRNSSYGSKNGEIGMSGDFNIGGTVFYVIVSPTIRYLKRCAKNFGTGRVPWILVPDSKLLAARVLLEMENLQRKVVVESLESSLGQTIWGCSEFADKKLAENLGRLLEEYNRRVAEIETDNSLQIEIPAALRSAQD